MISAQPYNWIGNPKAEMAGILAIPFLCCLLLFFIPVSILQSNDIPEFMWLFLVVFIDVGHVYSTLYRTYVDKELVSRHKNLFFGLPLLLLVVSILLHSTDSLLFWRALAYLAVYHFVRQQYGFMKLYSRKNNYSKTKQSIDAITIYAVTILPVLFWHVSNDRNFTWFIKGDFYATGFHPQLSQIIIVLFWLCAAVYSISEITESIRSKQVNLQKNAIVTGTALSWYLGIVHFNSDLVFTFLNIVCHGIPYMALVWIHGKKLNATKPVSGFLKIVYGRFSLLLFLLPLLLFSYAEEGLWDAFVWNEHGAVFFSFRNSGFTLSKSLLNIVVPLLSLPQLFHYVIDGFIWKIRNDKFEWTKIL